MCLPPPGLCRNRGIARGGLPLRGLAVHGLEAGATDACLYSDESARQVLGLAQSPDIAGIATCVVNCSQWQPSC